jgi:hypothetical protein
VQPTLQHGIWEIWIEKRRISACFASEIGLFWRFFKVSILLSMQYAEKGGGVGCFGPLRLVVSSIGYCALIERYFVQMAARPFDEVEAKPGQLSL